VIGHIARYRDFTGLLVVSVAHWGRNNRRKAGRPRWGLGPLLAATALLLQIAIPILHPAGPVGLISDAGDFSASFDEHALCLAGDRGTPRDPGDQVPKPVGHDFTLCCFWHGNTALPLVPVAQLELVAFARSRCISAPTIQASPRRLTGAIGARAPPIQA
jgi:hypothetical protein